ncbi:hypothetical protein AHiyo8_20740 [Arthrobacter sp. Hiyo8]|nr:hypothetical protein AHiyo8_20740 [Arthrobacter sp. Hiyo8]
MLDVEDLRDGFFDEVGVRHGLFDVLRGPQIGLQDCRGTFWKETCGHEFVRLHEQAVVVLLRDFGGHIRQRHARSPEGQDLRDPAAHVTGADDGDLPAALPSPVALLADSVMSHCLCVIGLVGANGVHLGGGR